jgi:hypothetical protein
MRPHRPRAGAENSVPPANVSDFHPQTLGLDAGRPPPELIGLSPSTPTKADCARHSLTYLADASRLAGQAAAVWVALIDK